MILKQLLGKILTDMGFVTNKQLEEALEKQQKIFKEHSVPERLQRANLVSEARRVKEIDNESLLGKILTDMGAISRGQLNEALEEQVKMVEEYDSLNSDKLGMAIEIGSIVNSTLNLAEVLIYIMRHANEVTNSVASTLMLLDDETGELVFSVPTGPKAEQLTDIRIPFGTGIAGWVAEHEQPALVPDAKKDTRFYEVIDKISDFETKSLLCVPIKSKTKLIGVLEVINKQDGTAFTKQDTLLLSIFAHQAAVAIENARLYGELKDRMGEILVNVLQRKQAEDALRKAHGELEQRIAKRTTDLTRTNEELREEIEKHKKTEKELEKSEQKYRDLVEKLTDVFFTTDKNGVISYVNPAIESLIGYSPSKVIGKHFIELFHTEDKHIAVESIRKTLFSQDVKNECRVYTKAGETRWVRTSIQPVFTGKKVTGLRGMLTDITQSKLIQEHLIQSERLNATCKLAASMAHEIDSPLQAINVHLSTMKSKYKDEKEHSENIELLKKSFDSIQNTVKNLLNLSHPGIEHRRPTNINRIIENTISLLNNHLKKSKIKVILELSPRIPEILASSQQIGQVCTNLINNSIEALTGIYNQNTGRNTRTSKRKKISIKTNYSKRTIIIKVSDNGPGIHKKDLDHIYDPFFTTRKKLGMGLGLSICYRIIEDHKGSIHVKNLPDAGGVTFTITLPVD